MIYPAQVLRLIYINYILVKHGLDEIILATHLFRPIRFLLYLMPWNWFRRHRERQGVRIRRTMEDLGPIFIKFGQLLSTRRDLLPEEVADELARLQDHVPPFPSEIARAIIEEAYGKPLTEVFASFNEQPMASASIAQVHAATLHDGHEVIIKVVRPDIQEIIQRDVELLKVIAGLAERYWSEGPRLRPLKIVSDYERTILDELDLMREAANASQLRRNFLDSPLLYIPEVYWDYTRHNVMVMERISGIPVSDIESLRRQGIDLKRLSEQGVEIFFTQVFSHNFFHADMHPGNIFVSREGRYIAVDFGIIGTLSVEDQSYLAANFLAFFNRDYRRVAELHVESGWVPRHVRVDEFESAVRSVCEPIFERPLKDISYGRLLLHLFQTAQRFQMEVQPQLILLQKTLLNIEGLGQQLYPDLDLWMTAKPFLERWMRNRVGPRAFVKTVQDRSPHWLMQLPQLPDLVFETLEMVRREKLQVKWRSDQLDHIHETIRRTNRRNFFAILGAGLLISAAILKLSDGLPLYAGAPLVVWLAAGLGLIALLRAWTIR